MKGRYVNRKGCVRERPRVIKNFKICNIKKSTTMNYNEKAARIACNKLKKNPCYHIA